LLTRKAKKRSFKQGVNRGAREEKDKGKKERSEEVWLIPSGFCEWDSRADEEGELKKIYSIIYCRSLPSEVGEKKFQEEGRVIRVPENHAHREQGKPLRGSKSLGTWAGWEGENISLYKGKKLDG